jgi:VWFA-related protein
MNSTSKSRAVSQTFQSNAEIERRELSWIDKNWLIVLFCAFLIILTISSIASDQAASAQTTSAASGPTQTSGDSRANQSTANPPAANSQPTAAANASAAPNPNADKTVTLPVVVHDKRGKVVTDLTKDDFTLQEDGRAETIKSFGSDLNLPLTVGLLVDTSRTQGGDLDAERNASKTFFDQAMTQDKDKGFVLHFDRQVELLQDLTSSHDKLQSALGLIAMNSDRDRSNDPNDSSNAPSHGESNRVPATQLYDAIYLSSNEVANKRQGRKVFILFADGLDRGSKTYIDTAIEAAQRTNTTIYTIFYAEKRQEENQGRGMGRGNGGGGYPGGGGGWPGGGGGGYPGGGGGYPGGGRGGRGQQKPDESSRKEGIKNLQRISKETGGRYFEVSKKQSVGEIYDSIVEELKSRYSIAYTPDKDSAPSGYHRVTLAVKRKDTTAETRDGYYADADAKSEDAKN